MKRLLGLVLVLCMAQVAVSEIYQSETDPSEVYESKTFGEINSMGGYQVGDKLFTDFSCITYTFGDLAVAPVCEAIVVTGVVIDGDYGIKFNAPWLAGEQSTINSTVSFKVLVVPGSDQYMVGNTFALTASSVTAPNGIVSAVETVWDAEPGSAGANRVAALDVLDSANQSNQKLSGYRDFYVNGTPAELKEIWIRKDITVSGGTKDQFCVTHLSEFTQTFHQIPEPASMGMLGTGILVAMLRRSRTRKSSRKEAKVDNFSPINSMALAGSVDAPYGSMTGEAYVYGGRKVEAEHSNF